MVAVVVDVESNGPLVGRHSMVSLAAVVCEEGLRRTYCLRVRPLSKDYEPKALKAIGATFAETETYDDPALALPKFRLWLQSLGSKPTMWSDNPVYDWQWVNYYLLSFAGTNPFGHSARRIGDLYCGMVGNLNANPEWKRDLRRTPHTHNPLDDARGNAEALLQMFEMIKQRAMTR